MSRLLFLFLFLMLFFSLSAQQKKYPYLILPGQKTDIEAKDTLWLITHKQFKKTISTAKKLEILKQICLKDSLRTLKKDSIIFTQKQLIDTLKADRDFYINQLEECESDIESFSKITNRYKRNFNLALIGGGIFGVSMFFLGAYLFH